MELVVVFLALAIVAVGILAFEARRAAVKATQPEREDATPTANPGGCTKEGHEWRKRPHLVSGYEEVYYCKKNCGSTLRHRVK